MTATRLPAISVFKSGMLHLDNNDGGAVESVVRSADLSRATTATLSSYFEGFGGGSTDMVTISVSNDGGTTWTAMRQGNIVGSPSGTRVQNVESYGQACTVDRGRRAL
jgi:hypothetical protein